MIKDEINELIQSYKDDFFEKTGLTLYSVAETGVKKVPLNKIIKLAEKHYSVPEGVLVMPGRKRSYVIAKKAIIHVASDMGYLRVEVASALNVDHTTVVHHLQESRNEFRAEGQYKTDLIKFKELIRRNS